MGACAVQGKESQSPLHDAARTGDNLAAATLLATNPDAVHARDQVRIDLAYPGDSSTGSFTLLLPHHSFVVCNSGCVNCKASSTFHPTRRLFGCYRCDMSIQTFDSHRHRIQA